MAWENDVSEGLELGEFANIRRVQFMLEFQGPIKCFHLNQHQISIKEHRAEAWNEKVYIFASPHWSGRVSKDQ